MAPRLRCDGGSTAVVWRNMLKVSAVPPIRSAVLIVFEWCYGDKLAQGPEAEISLIGTTSGGKG